MNMSAITKLGVVGGGQMGAGIAEVAAKAGSDVLIMELEPAFAERSRARLVTSLQRAVDRGKMDEAARDAATIENDYLDLVRSVSQQIDIPLAVKVGPYFSAFAHMAGRLVEAGADALVLFNRFYQPDVDLEDMTVSPNLELSTSRDLRLPLRWIAILYGQIDTQLAATSGVHSEIDVAKLLLAGADVTMTTASLLLHGPSHLTEIVANLERWLDDNGYSSLLQLRGSLSQRNAPDPMAFERHNYMKTLQTFGATRRR